MRLLIEIVGIVLILEAIPWVASPAGTKRILREVAALGDRVLRLVGLAALLLGLFLVFCSAR